MTKDEFLFGLSSRLGALPADERARSLDFFAEMIDDRVEDGLTEEQAVASLEDLDAIAETLSRSEPRRDQPRLVAGTTRSISVRDVFSPVRLLPSPDQEVRLDYRETPYKDYRVEESPAGLEVVGHSKLRWYDLVGFLRGSEAQFFPLTLYLPRDYAGDVTVDCRAGRVTATDLVLRGSLSLTSRDAAVVVRHVSADDIVANSRNARVELSGVTGRRVTARTNNSRIEAIDVTSGSDLRLETSNARIDATTTCAEQDLILETSNSRIMVDRIQAGRRIALRTNNARIEGRIADAATSFVIRAHTTNSSSNLPTNWQGGPKELDVQTSNARIVLDFDLR